MHKKWPNNFSGKFGEIRAKIFHTPKNLPAPTLMRKKKVVNYCHMNIKQQTLALVFCNTINTGGLKP